MRLTQFRRQVCPNRNIPYRIARQDPIDWIVPPANNRYAVFPLHGYVVRLETGEVTALFEKAAYTLEQNETLETAAFPAEQIRENPRIENVTRLADLLKVPYHLFLWSPNFPQIWTIAGEGERSMFGAEMRQQGDVFAEPPTRMSLSDFRQILRKYRGGSLERYRALNSAESRLECYLSAIPGTNGFDPWPGDFDAVVYDTEQDRVAALVEFKTHNIDRPIENEWFGNYPEDRYRAEVVFRLADAISARQAVPPDLYYVVWGTQDYQNHSQIRITTLADRNNLRGLGNQMLRRPPFGDFDSQFFDYITRE
jgi:hypothetical protein